MLDDCTMEAPTAHVCAKGTNAVPLESGSASTVSKRGKNDGRVVRVTAPHNPSVTALLPIMGVVLVAFLVIGLALPVLPLHVHHDLGLGTFVVGLVTGSQFAASLISRVWSGRYSDRRGAKRAVVVGLLTAVMAGLLYLVSLRFVGTPWLSVTILLLGRGLLGGAESFLITGAVSWGLALAGPQNAGRVIAWVGMSMFAALAFGAPVGTTLYAIGGFTAVAVATILVPLITVLLVAPLSPVPAQRAAQAGLMKVLGAVWLPGFGSALSSVGFGAMIAFSSLLSAERGLSPLWLTFSAFAIALVAARLFLGHTPDRLGGAKIALVCVFIEAGGLALIWFASNPVLAAAGAALTGFGYSLVYPGLGVEAVRRAPPQSRGLAMGAYTVFLDVALGFSSPALGLLAGWTGLGSVFLASAILVLCAAVVAAWLLRKNSPKEKQSWGVDYPPAKRNEEWEVQAFNADKSVNNNENLDRCFCCHKGQAQQDFVYMLGRMKTAN
jgi:MFS family permease